MKVDSKKIIEFVKKERVVTSSDLAKHLKISWNTAEKYLMEVLIEGKLDRIKKEGTTLWMEKE
jgi:predicted HTH transcriptional regulator